MMTDSFQEIIDYFDQVASRLSRTKNMHISSGQKQGPGVKSTDNLNNKIKLAKTNEEAVQNARTRAAKLNQPFDEGNATDEEISKRNEQVITDIVNDFVDNIFGD